MSARPPVTAAPGAGDRFCHSGEHLPGIHLVDLHMYDSSLFANACILVNEETLVIFDAGTSLTTGEIVNHVDFHGIDVKKAIVIPSHHHFDHAGGIVPLLRHFTARGIAASVLTTTIMAPLLEAPGSHVDKALPLFGKMMGSVEPVSPDDMTIVDPGAIVDLGGNRAVQLLATPGHCPDHVSPVIIEAGRPVACFFGEALGINLKRALSPLPAATAPGYDAVAYKRSVESLLALDIEAGFFSHVGGVRGQGAITATCKKALAMLEEIEHFTIEMARAGTGGTREVVARLKHRYREYLATCVMDATVVDNLSFLVALGIMKEAGVK